MHAMVAAALTAGVPVAAQGASVGLEEETRATTYLGFGGFADAGRGGVDLGAGLPFDTQSSDGVGAWIGLELEATPLLAFHGRLGFKRSSTRTTTADVQASMLGLFYDLGVNVIYPAGDGVDVRLGGGIHAPFVNQLRVKTGPDERELDLTAGIGPSVEAGVRYGVFRIMFRGRQNRFRVRHQGASNVTRSLGLYLDIMLPAA